MTDPISIGAIVISSLTALGGVIAGIHIKRLKSGCCESECFETAEHKLQRQRTLTPPHTPITKQPPKTVSVV